MKEIGMLYRFTNVSVAVQGLCILAVLVDAWVFAELVHDAGAGMVKAVVAFAVFLASGLWIAFRHQAQAKHKIAHEILLDAALAYASFSAILTLVQPEYLGAHVDHVAGKWRMFGWLILDGPADFRICFVIVFLLARPASYP